MDKLLDALDEFLTGMNKEIERMSTCTANAIMELSKSIQYIMALLEPSIKLLNEAVERMGGMDAPIEQRNREEKENYDKVTKMIEDAIKNPKEEVNEQRGDVGEGTERGNGTSL